MKEHILALLQKCILKLYEYLMAWGRDQLHFAQSKDKIQLSETFPCWLLSGSWVSHRHYVFTPASPVHTHRNSSVSSRPTKRALGVQNKKLNRGANTGVLPPGTFLGRQAWSKRTVLQRLRQSLDGDGTGLGRARAPAQEDALSFLELFSPSQNQLIYIFKFYFF